MSITKQTAKINQKSIDCGGEMDVAQEGNTHSSLICASTPKNVVQEPRLRAAGGRLEHTGGEERERNPRMRG